jgi:hypothetical protein
MVLGKLVLDRDVHPGMQLRLPGLVPHFFVVRTDSVSPVYLRGSQPLVWMGRDLWVVSHSGYCAAPVRGPEAPVDSGGA